jgi:hypothetical protein
MTNPAVNDVLDSLPRSLPPSLPRSLPLSLATGEPVDRDGGARTRGWGHRRFREGMRRRNWD